MSDKMREAFANLCKECGPTISFYDFEMGWDAALAEAVPVVGEPVSWLPWHPLDACPVPAEVRVVIRQRNGISQEGEAHDFEWGRISNKSDHEIVAWRRADGPHIGANTWPKMFTANISAAELERLLRNDALYHELLFSVASKYPNESCHDTALRYIRNAESGRAAIAAEGEK